MDYALVRVAPNTVQRFIAKNQNPFATYAHHDSDGAATFYKHTLDIFLKHPEHLSNDVIIFVGGAADRCLKHMQRVFSRYVRDYATVHKHDVWYTTFNGTPYVAKLIRAYNKAGKKVAVIGHSWGASASTRLLHHEQSLLVNFFMTLDPVSRRKPPLVQSKGIRAWHNVYVDYALSERSFPNFVATVGGPWKKLAVCGESNDMEWMLGNNHFDHADAHLMFYNRSNFALFCQHMGIENKL